MFSVFTQTEMRYWRYGWSLIGCARRQWRARFLPMLSIRSDFVPS